jgi:hypothetical protein
MDEYDIELRSSGSGWTGTFSNALAQVIADITEEKPWDRAEVTLYGGHTYTGVLSRNDNASTSRKRVETFRIDDMVFAIEDVLRFRA